MGSPAMALSSSATLQGASSTFSRRWLAPSLPRPCPLRQRLLRRCLKAPASAESSPGAGSKLSLAVETSTNELKDSRAKESVISDELAKDISKVVKKTAGTFAPRPSTKTRNPAVPGSTLYKIFEVQGYACMALGGLLSFNLLFPSDQPDIWRLMGMWSVWMFTIPSLRARDCSDDEKSALNYLFLAIPLVNITLPLFWKSFAAVWTADIITFFAFYAWKLNLLDRLKSGQPEDQ